MTLEHTKLNIQMDIAFHDALKIQRHLVRGIPSEQRANFLQSIDLISQLWELKKHHESTK